jgi:nucleoside-diphosphate-sugar epimerase
MRVLVTGADDVWGQLAAEAVLAAPSLRDPFGHEQQVDALVLMLHEEPWDRRIEADSRVRVVRGDIAHRAEVEEVFAAGLIDSVIHFETVTRDRDNGEDDFGGMVRTNMLGSLNLLECCRAQEHVAKFVFCSSCSVFKDGLLEPVSEQTPRTPSSTYGTTKAIVEMLVNNYSARGFVDGRSSILPMCVSWRPDRRSGEFLYDMFDEPFNGEEIVLPIRPDTRIFFNGWHTCIPNLVELHELDADRLGENRSVLQPGLSVTIQEMLDAFARAAESRRLTIGPVVEKLQPAIQEKVDAYNKFADTSRAAALGLSSEDLDSLVNRYLDVYLETADGRGKSQAAAT